MVWGFFPADPRSGEDKYYIFRKGTYKVGRKGCDVIINKDKGVSRIHAEIVIDAMTSSKIQIRDCSKYGTFVNRSLRSKENVHEFPNKEATVGDGDLVSFGTGNATYRLFFVPIVFYACQLQSFQANKLLLQDKISSIGASMTTNWSPECTHVLVDEFTPVKEDVVDTIVAKRPFVSYNWVEFIAEKNIGSEIPSCSSYAPTLTWQGVSVKVTDPKSRENCLKGYTFLLEPIHKYQAKDRLQLLLEVVGAKVVPAEKFYPDSQGLEVENDHVVPVIPAGLAEISECFKRLGSLPRVSETNLICATLSGYLDPSILVSPPVLVTSSCSTDETVVADSDPEIEITSVHSSAAVQKIESIEGEGKGEIAAHRVEYFKHEDKVDMPVHSMRSIEHESKGNTSTDDADVRSKYGHATCSRDINDGLIKSDECGSGNSDILYGQDLIVRDTNVPASVRSPMNSAVLNFKRFRKMGTQSGNSFNNLIPFSKYPYKDSEYSGEEAIQSVKEEKRRKQMEAVAEELFNNEKARRRGVAGSIHGLFARS